MNLTDFLKGDYLSGGIALIVFLVLLKVLKLGVIVKVLRSYLANKKENKSKSSNSASNFQSKKKALKVRQHDISDCAAACIASISGFYSFITSVSKIRQIATTDKEGTNIVGVLKALEAIGFEAKAAKGDIQSLYKIPLPCIIHIYVKDVLLHYVVLYKISKRKVTVMDPSDGDLHIIPISKFQKIWTGKMVICLPGVSFEKGNEKVSILSRFGKLIRTYKKLVSQALFGGAVYTIIGLSTAIYVQKITDHVLVSENTNLLNLMGVAMLILLFVQTVVNALKSIYTLKLGQSIDVNLISAYYQHLLRLPQRFFDSMRTGDLVSRINDAMSIRQFLSQVFLNIIINLMILFAAFCLMFTYYWKLALMITIVVPVYSIVYSLFNKWNKKVERDVMEDAAELESQLVESIGGMRTIKQLNASVAFQVKSEFFLVKLLKSFYKSGKNLVFASVSTDSVNRALVIVLLWVGAVMVINKEMTPGELLSFYALVGYFTTPVSEIINSNKSLQEASIAADRLFEVIDLPEDINEGKVKLSEGYDIKLVDVSFQYGTRRNVFENLNVEFKKGCVTGIVGGNGTGKSTLVSLISGLYKPDSGKIYFGKYASASIESLPKQFGIVSQKIDLFSGTLAENVALGEFHPDMNKMIELCEEIGILEFIYSLPHGFETQLGENGLNLSGGQRQKIAIVRALYSNPKYFVFDEATASLDYNSSKFITNFIYGKLKKSGKTIVLVSHKLSDVRRADNIVVLGNNNILEIGDHETLMNNQGEYYNMKLEQESQIRII